MAGGALAGRSLTYSQLDARSRALAQTLRDQGLQPGDHVAMLIENRPEVFEVYWAAVRSGLYITAVNHHLSTAEIAYIVNDCGARTLFVSATFAHLAAELARETPGVERRLMIEGAAPEHEPYEQAIRDALPAATPLVQPRGADMLYSSGTTGRPKGIKRPLPQREVDEPGDPTVASFGRAYAFGPDTVYYSAAPQYHGGPLRFGALTHMLGGTLVLAERFDAEQSLAHLERFRVTHSQWVPTMFIRMLKLPPAQRDAFDLSSMRCAIHAASPCPPEVKRQMIDWWGPILEEYYSSTEQNGSTRISSPEWLARPGSVGQAKVGVIHICDSSGAELPPGEVGTVFFEQATPPFEYHNDPAKTLASRHPRHADWTSIGDLGRVDEDGWLYLADRSASLILSGGVNIYPREIEDCLALHPAVDDVAVTGVPDEEMGQAVKALVVVADGYAASPDLERELIEFARSKIARFKAPRSIEFADSVPRNAIGKIVRQQLSNSPVG